jgi:hypothetical protein
VILSAADDRLTNTRRNTTLIVVNREITLHIVLADYDAAREKKKIRNLLFSDLWRWEEGFVLIMQY